MVRLSFFPLPGGVFVFESCDKNEQISYAKFFFLRRFLVPYFRVTLEYSGNIEGNWFFSAVSCIPIAIDFFVVQDVQKLTVR